MKKIHIGLTMFAVFAFSAVASSSALAASAILLNGAEIKETTPFELTGELLVEDMKVVGMPDILCMLTFDGVINAGGVTGSITAALTLEGALLEGVGGADLIECEAHSICEIPPDVEMLNLPWSVEVMLSAGGLWYFLINAHAGGGEPGYSIDCVTIVGLVADTCTGNTSALLTNEAGGLLVELLEVEEEGITPPLNCTQGGLKEGLNSFSGVTTFPSGVATVS
jgi:hypothetical protein